MPAFPNATKVPQIFGAVAGSIAAAIRVVATCRKSGRTWQRLWRRFDLSQSKIRSALSARRPPPCTALRSRIRRANSATNAIRILATDPYLAANRLHFFSKLLNNSAKRPSRPQNLYTLYSATTAITIRPGTRSGRNPSLASTSWSKLAPIRGPRPVGCLLELVSHAG